MSNKVVIQDVRPNVVTVTESVTKVATIAQQGPPGPPGVDKSYVHEQHTPDTTWVIHHNLSKFPSVTVVDSGGTNVVGNIVYDTVNTVTLTFSAAFSGKAFFN